MRQILPTMLVLLATALPAFAQDAMPDIPDHLDIPDPAQELPLEDESLRALFVDTTHRGFYDIRGVRNGENNLTETMSADGKTVHTLDGVVSEGSWRTRGPVVCFEYADLHGGCFSIYQRGTCYYAYSVTSRQFVAVSVIDGAEPTCEAPYV